MSGYRYFDWRYVLPCADRVPAEALEVLHPWLRSLLDLSPTALRKELRKRWTKLIAPLHPFRDRLLEAGGPALVSRGGAAFLELTLGTEDAGVDWPWIPREWSTPVKFLPDAARRYCKAHGITPHESSLESQVYQHWSEDRYPPGYRVPREDEGLSDLYVAPPPKVDEVRKTLRRFGLPSKGTLAEFLCHFDFFREDFPGSAGGFEPVRAWETIEDAASRPYSWYAEVPSQQTAQWKGSVILFTASNGDEVLLQPSGPLGWMSHEEALVHQVWNDFDDFIVAYADALEYRWPFDRWGPSEEAIAGRKQRERKGKWRRL